VGDYFPVPQGDPDALDQAAHQVGRTGTQLLSRRASVTTAAAEASHAWSGPAMVTFVGRTRAVQGLHDDGHAALATIGPATTRYAGVLRTVIADVHDFNRRLQAAEGVVTAYGRQLDYGVSAAASRALASAQQDAAALRAALQREYDARMAELRHAASSFAQTLDEAAHKGIQAGKDTASSTLKSLEEKFGHGFDFAKKAKGLWNAGKGLWNARNLPSFLRYLTAGTALERLGALGGMMTFSKAMTGGLLAKVGLWGTVATGAWDVIGPGHSWTQRGMGLVGAGGAGTLLAASGGLIALGPVGWGIAGAAVIGYTVYKNWGTITKVAGKVWDGMKWVGGKIGQGAQIAWNATARAASAAWKKGDQIVTSSLNEGKKLLGNAVNGAVSTAKNVGSTITHPSRILHSIHVF
jgi:hypothetical protein